MKLIMISGLGADERAFEKIGDVGIEKIAIEWLAFDEEDTIDSYAKKIIEAYQIESEDVLLGLSFGGLLAQQIGKIYQSDRVILVSSFQSKSHLQGIFRFGLSSKLYKILPNYEVPRLAKKVAISLNSGDPSSDALLTDMAISIDIHFVNWAIRQIAALESPILPENSVYNIIGDSDKIMQLWQNEKTTIIPSGGHFMVYEQADLITEEIKNIICKMKESNLSPSLS